MDAKVKKSSSGHKPLELSRFADYFVICGLDIENGLEAEHHPDGVTNLNIPPLDRSYKSKTLAHFPSHVSWNPFDSYGTCMLSLPQGLRFRTQKHDLEPRFHSFASTRDDGKRCYGFSLVFYEETKNENICTAMQTLQSMFICELSSSQGSLRRQDPVSRSLPRHFRLGDDDKNSSPGSFYDIQKDTLYVTKSITIICQFPYAHVAEVFLTNLYKCLPRSPGARMSLESYVYNILYDVKVPDCGKSIRIYLPPEQPNQSPINIILQRPKITELPLLDFPLRLLFSFLGIECVIELFTCVLLENQVLLKSKDFQKLTIVAECITSLLFPFEWCHVYAPILPTALHHFLDAPVPFVMGLHAESLDANVQQRIGLCYVDIDSKTIRLPEELPTFPHKSDFIAEIYEALGKFHLPEKIEPPTPAPESESTILNPKNLLMNNNFYFQSSQSSNDKYSNIQYQRLSASPASTAATLTLTKSRRKKHSLHDLINDFDYSGPSSGGSDHHDSASTSNMNNCMMPGATTNDQYYNDLRLNAEIREIFLNRFCQVFLDYEQFVILPNQNKAQWLTNRESMHNFDKASFLSDQTAQYRPFLSQFLESQMFATLIDNKIMTSFDDKPSGSGSGGGGSTEKGKKVDEDYSSFDVHVNKNLQLFDNRIKILKKNFGSAEEIGLRWKSLETIPHLHSSKVALEKRLKNFDLEVSPPSEVLRKSPAYYKSFPLLEASALNQVSSERPNSLRRVKKKMDLDDRKLHEKKNNQMKFYLREIDIDKNLSGSAESLSISSSVGVPSNNDEKGSKTEEFTASFVAQTNWTFVEKLLKECKTKTKRMLMEKIDMEVGGSADVEENSLITSMCDLLEKIWSHGLITPHSKSAHTKNHYHNNNQIKSPFWSHLLRYFEKQEKMIAMTNGGSTKNNGKLDSDAQLLSTPDLSSLKVEPQEMSSSFISTSLSTTPSPTASLQRRQQQQKSRRSKSCEKRTFLSSPDNAELVLPKMPESLEYDIRNILSMHEIKTDIGYARAFVRLTLEKKLLSRHLKTLLSDISILRSMYKRTAFLTYEDEKEQFLYHLLTLNAVDYFCFTQVYGMTIIPYRIVIVPVSGTGTLTRKSSMIPKLWLIVFGSIGETERISLNKIELLMEHKNLGILRTLRIGIDASQNTSTLTSSTKLHLDCVWIRNEITGHAYKFSCNRWLGKGIDDGSMERLLIGQLIRPTTDPMDDQCGNFGSLPDKSPNVAHKPPPHSSPASMTDSFISNSTGNEEKKDPNEIQNGLSDSVNKIVKWFYRHQRRLMSGVDCSNDMAALTNLLCGEGGFVECLMAAFMLGFRSQRLFGRNFFLWDFFVRCKDEFEQNLTADTLATMQGQIGRHNNGEDEQMRDIWDDYCQLVDEISKNSTIGSDEKFQLFICLCLREHLLHRMLPALSASRTSQEMYDDKSFLRQKSLNRFLFQILQPLGEFPFDLDSSITSSLNASNC